MVKNKKMALLAVGLATFFSSCDPEKEEPILLKTPTINLELSGKPEMLHNEVAIGVSSHEDEVIEKVEFFLNEQSIGEDHEIPFEILWNTKEVEDGTYILKAVAHNASGKGEVAKEVKVKNTLMVVHVENAHTHAWDGQEVDSWIYLSDKNGHVLGEAQQVVDGSSMTFYRPADFNADTIYLNRLNYSSFFPDYYTKPIRYLTVSTYPNFPFNEIQLFASSVSESREPFGQADISVKNDFDVSELHNYSTQISARGSVQSSNRSSIAYSVNMNEETGKGISTYETSWWPDKVKEREKYMRLDNFEAGKAYEFHTNEYKAMNAQSITVPYSFESLLIHNFGFLSKENEQAFDIDLLVIHDDQNNEFMFFDSDLFSSQHTVISVSLKNKSFLNTINGKAPNVIAEPDFSASVNKDDRNIIQVNPQGTFDIGFASWQHMINNDTESYNIRRNVYFSSQPDITYAMPEVPDEILEIYPELDEQMDYHSIFLLDNKKLTSYQDIMKQWFTDTYKGWDYYPRTSLTLYPEKEEKGGRILGSKTIKEAHELLEEQQLRARGAHRH